MSMGGNPNLWGMHYSQSHHHQFLTPEFAPDCSSSSSSSFCSTTDVTADHYPNQDFPGVRSWSQLVLGGLLATGTGSEEEKVASSVVYQQQHYKKLLEENWKADDDRALNLSPSCNSFTTRVLPAVDHVKHEVVNIHAQPAYPSQLHDNTIRPNPWPALIPLSNSFVFAASGGRPTPAKKRHCNQDHLPSECNSGGAPKKARVHHSSAQPALKVRKEKLGDRITALHQMVSPFGKTDTASVLSEAIDYIRFLQDQIEALSSPYIRSGSIVHQQHSCMQLLNRYMGMDERTLPSQESGAVIIIKDLRSRGLCLVPVSCTQHVATDSGADLWAPAAF